MDKKNTRIGGFTWVVENNAFVFYEKNINANDVE